eukprot:1157646-Pelagomonas_calceolata.AAC.18
MSGSVQAHAGLLEGIEEPLNDLPVTVAYCTSEYAHSMLYTLGGGCVFSIAHWCMPEHACSRLHVRTWMPVLGCI